VGGKTVGVVAICSGKCLGVNSLVGCTVKLHGRWRRSEECTAGSAERHNVFKLTLKRTIINQPSWRGFLPSLRE
jgi:hypothetical protein